MTISVKTRTLVSLSISNNRFSVRLESIALAVAKLRHTRYISMTGTVVLHMLNRIWSETTRGSLSPGFRVVRNVTILLFSSRLTNRLTND